MTGIALVSLLLAASISMIILFRRSSPISDAPTLQHTMAAETPNAVQPLGPPCVLSAVPDDAPQEPLGNNASQAADHDHLSEVNAAQSVAAGLAPSEADASPEQADRHATMAALVRDGYNNSKYAETFRTDMIPRPFEQAVFDRFFTLLPTNPVIIDLGCGPGLPYDRYMVDKGGQVTGVDISHKHLQLAKQSVPEATFIEADFSNWSASQKYDAVVCMYAFFHIPREEHKAFFERMTSMIHYGGLLMCTLTGDQVGGQPSQWLGAPMAWSSFAPHYYLELLYTLGFAVVHVADHRVDIPTENHLWIIAKKMV